VSEPVPAKLVPQPVPERQWDPTFHDPREIAAAVLQNKPTPQGAPLNPYAQDLLSQIHDGVKAVQEWMAHVDQLLNKIDQFPR
jgi:uncharacterized protein YqcC (DUF446 family)